MLKTPEATTKESTSKHSIVANTFFHRERESGKQLEHKLLIPTL